MGERRIPFYRFGWKCVRFDVDKCDAILLLNEQPSVRKYRKKVRKEPVDRNQIELSLDVSLLKRGKEEIFTLPMPASKAVEKTL